MKASNKFTKTLISTVGIFLFFSSSTTVYAAALNVSQKPLILNETVAPNLVFTLDDSGSMRWAYAPDSIGRGNTSIINTPRAASATTNPMYYNPNVTYSIPPKINADGTEAISGYTTSFTKASQNGFHSSRGTVDLSKNYKVSWIYDTDSSSAKDYSYESSENYAAPNGNIKNLSKNPNKDFGNQDIILPQGTSIKINYLGVEYTLSRGTNSSSCSISPTAVNGLNCKRVNGNNFKIERNKTESGVPAYYYVFDSSRDDCTTADKNLDSCYKIVFVSQNSGPDGRDERQNFTNWYSFYRTRALATVSAATIAFNDLPPTARLTWQSLGLCTTLNSESCGKNYLRDYTARHKANFFNWINTVEFNQSTPLLQAAKRAGEFYTTATPWMHTPNPITSNGGKGKDIIEPQYVCRPSYHILMTDGMWNDSSEVTGITRHDRAVFQPGTSNDGAPQYDGRRAPYGNDTTSNRTLADIAMHYWATDLRSSLNNGLSPYIPFKDNDAAKQFWDPRNNPATWQHMVNYTMGLGLTNSLNVANLPWTGNTFEGNGYKRLSDNSVTNPQLWPAASASSDNNVYDLWHAAINSRGEFFSVDSPDAMVQAFKDILNRIADRTTTAARPAVSASFVSDNSANSLKSNVYATMFSSEDWSGEIIKTELVNYIPNTVWSTRQANANLNPNSRPVYIANPSASNARKLQYFTWENIEKLNNTFQDTLNINPESLTSARDNRGQQRLDYILGDRSQEGFNVNNFRKRGTTVIGDIINSSPVIVGTPSYLAYLADNIERYRANYQSYGEFREQNRRRSTTHPKGRQEMIYVGANDGILHGINADTGVIEFGFIPTAVIKNLYRLTGKNYVGGEHNYYVDGSPIVRDVYFEDQGWRTVLIGTLRAGGKYMFALDITNPDEISLLWEFSSDHDADLGYTFAQPEIVRLHTGQWAVLQGNGYDSLNDRAALFVLDIQTGSVLKKIQLPEIVQDNTILPNGLSTIRGADYNNDGIIDYAYGGDLQGNLWRFDLVKTTSDETFSYEEGGQKISTYDPFDRRIESIQATTVNDFKLAFGDRPLFVAMDSADTRQPITIQPSIVRHPRGYGYLILFGTGKYFESSDANVNTSRNMTTYGIWDRHTKREITGANTITALGKNKSLQKQWFESQSLNIGFNDNQGNTTNHDIRLLTNNNPRWLGAPTNQIQADIKLDEHVNNWGWALEMAVYNKAGSSRTLSGELVVNNMTTSGSVLFFSSLTPNKNPCQAGAETWLYGINAHTGGRTRFDIFDMNSDRIIDSGDRSNLNTVSGLRFPALGGFTLSPGNLIFGSDGADGALKHADDPNTSGRQSWHIIPEEFR